MKQQRDLFARSDLKVTPEKGRLEPRFWVRKLVIWKDPQNKLREIPLRPGLNIIWSPDPSDRPVGEDNAEGLGHGSGKSMFCRLLRYCLGEDRFADDDQRPRITFALEQGLVGAEVIVEGVPWAVLRPIGRGHRHLAIPNVDLEALIAGEYQHTGISPFLDAVETRILTKPVAELIGGHREAVAWLLSLAWLSRDQECRFDHVVDWRSAFSDSDSPARALSQSERLAALRALIGAIVPGEYALRAEVEALTRRHEAAERESDHLAWETSRLRSQLIDETGVTENEVPSGPLGVEVLRKAAKRRLAQMAGVGPDTDVANMETLGSELEEAQNRAGDLRAHLAEIEGRIPSRERVTQLIASELPGAAAAVNSAEEPICPVCEVPIDQALAEGCKLSVHLPNLAELKRRYQEREEELASVRSALETDRKDVIRLRQELGDAMRDLEQRRETLRAAESVRATRGDAWSRTRRLLEDADRLGELLTALDDAQANAESRNATIEEKRERLGLFRDEQAHVFKQLSTFFDAIVGRLVHGASGKVTLDGNGLKLSVELGGDRSTTAISSLKVIAFDLAVMCMSIEGSIRLPAFLVHDSPREADLGLSVYHRLFDVVRALEPDDGRSLFQYIVTTTTPPPDRVRKSPWLAETLHGTPAQARLLKQDL